MSAFSRPLRAALAAALASAILAAACAPRVTPPPVVGAPTAAPRATLAVAPSPTPPRAPLPSPSAAPEPVPARCHAQIPTPPVAGRPVHTLEFFDIGQGDAEVLRTATGKTILVDSGDRDHSATLVKDLRAAGVDRIDMLAASHPHLDHIGGMDGVIAAFPIRLYVDPGTDHPTETYAALLGTVKTKQTPYQVLRAGKTLRIGEEATLSVLSPPKDHLIVTERSPENANSLVIEVQIGAFRALLTGDAEPETLAALGPALGHVDLLKVAHHGSRYGTNATFLDEVTPKVATISLGAGNDYHHPHKETVALLAERCISTYRTDRDGNITVVTDGQGFRVTTAHGTTPEQAVPGPGGDEPRADDPTAVRPGGPPALAAATPAPKTAPGADLRVYASRRGKTYHPAGCTHLTRIHEENLVEYGSAEEAEAAGLRPAANCHAAGAPRAPRQAPP